MGHLDAVANTQDIITLAGIIKDVWSDVPAAQVRAWSYATVLQR